MCEMKIRDGKKKIDLYNVKTLTKSQILSTETTKLHELSTMSMRVFWPPKRTFDVPCLLFHCTSYR